MKWPIVALVAAVTAATASAQNRGLTDAEVDAAIAAAKEPKFQSMFVEAHGRFAAYYTVILQGPVGRTTDIARDAFDSYKPMTADKVPAGVRAHAVTLAVLRHGGSESIKNVVIMPPGATSRDAAIQPLPPLRLLAGRDVRPRTWKPGLGSATSSGLPMFYRFAEDELPPGDLQILVVTSGGEERYTVKAEERDRIR